MDGSLHAFGGVALGVTTTCIAFQEEVVTNPLYIPVIIAPFYIGALLPDADAEYSTINSMCPAVSLLSVFFKHRGIVHTPLWWFICTVIPVLLLRRPIVTLLFAELFFGCIMHLLQDTCTSHGIMWLFPFTRNYYHIPFPVQSHMLWRSLILTVLIAYILAKFVMYVFCDATSLCTVWQLPWRELFTVTQFPYGF